MPDSVFRDLMLDQLAKRSGMNTARLQERVFGGENSLREEFPKPHSAPSGRSPVRTAIHLLLEQPQLAETVTTPCGFEDFDAPGIALLSKLLEILHESPNLSAGGILEYWRGQPEEKQLAKLARAPLDIPPEGLGEEFRDAVQRLVEQRNSYRMELLLFQSRRQELSDAEKSELKELLAMRHPGNG
jgi:DNA primase